MKPRTKALWGQFMWSVVAILLAVYLFVACWRTITEGSPKMASFSDSPLDEYALLTLWLASRKSLRDWYTS